MTRIALALLAAAAAAAADRSGGETDAGGVRTPVMRVCYLDLAEEQAKRCAVPPRREAEAS